MSSVIRSLMVKVGADINDFQKKMGAVAKDLEKSAKKWNALGTSLTKSVTLPAIAAAAGIGALVNKTADYADAIQNMSVRTGMSYKTLQELRFVTDQTGVSFDAVGTSLVAFTKTLDDSMKKGSDVSQIYGLLGINIKGTGDKLKPVNELYNEAIKKLSGISDETAQAMIASKLFGKQYEEILPLMRLAPGELEKMAKKANELGLVMSDTSINSMAEFQDRLGAIKLRLQASGMQMAEKFMPIVEKLAGMAETTFIPALGKIIDFVGKMIDKFNELDPKVQNSLLVFAGAGVLLGPAITGFSSILSLLSQIIKIAPTVATALKGLGLSGGLVGLGAIAAIGTTTAIINNFNKAKQQAEQFKQFNAAKDAGNLRNMMPGEKMAGGFALTGQAGTDAWKSMQKNPPATVQSESDKWLSDFNKKWDAYVKKLGDGATKAADKMDTLKDSVRQMVDALKEQTKAFANFVGLFDVFERKSVSGTRLLNRLKAQVKAMSEWRSSLASLEKRGVSQQFLNDLRSMGPSAVDSINALSKMSNEQLKQYTGLYNQKFALGGAEASKMVSANMKANTVIEKQVILNVTGSKGDAEVIANTIVKKLRLAGYTI
jgi:hypothetical protein